MLKYWFTKHQVLPKQGRMCGIKERDFLVLLHLFGFSLLNWPLWVQQLMEFCFKAKSDFWYKDWQVMPLQKKLHYTCIIFKVVFFSISLPSPADQTHLSFWLYSKCSELITLIFTCKLLSINISEHFLLYFTDFLTCLILTQCSLLWCHHAQRNEQPWELRGAWIMSFSGMPMIFAGWTCQT